MIYIGIDPGVNTGVAIWAVSDRKFLDIKTVGIVGALEYVNAICEAYVEKIVRIEDARKRKWFGKSGREKLQGAGSIKRDCQIWEEFLTDIGVKFEMVAPKNNRTKLNAKTFKAYTKWDKPTNQHGRDAAMLVFNRK